LEAHLDSVFWNYEEMEMFLTQGYDMAGRKYVFGSSEFRSKRKLMEESHTGWMRSYISGVERFRLSALS
jgi:hypothetical protein